MHFNGGTIPEMAPSPWSIGVQERPQDFGFLGVNAHLPPEEKKILKI